eukprot:674209-Rhodomonas_salina.1
MPSAVVGCLLRRHRVRKATRSEGRIASCKPRPAVCVQLGWKAAATSLSRLVSLAPLPAMLLVGCRRAQGRGAVPRPGDACRGCRRGLLRTLSLAHPLARSVLSLAAVQS